VHNEKDMGWIKPELKVKIMSSKERTKIEQEFYNHHVEKAKSGLISGVRLVFRDSYGNDICVGDNILIEHNYNYPNWNGREAEVYWDEKHGVFMFKFWTSMRKSGHWTKSNFYGIHKFKRITENGA
jgi:hypothetical protein